MKPLYPIIELVSSVWSFGDPTSLQSFTSEIHFASEIRFASELHFGDSLRFGASLRRFASLRSFTSEIRFASELHFGDSLRFGASLRNSVRRNCPSRLPYTTVLSDYDDERPDSFYFFSSTNIAEAVIAMRNKSINGMGRMI